MASAPAIKVFEPVTLSGRAVRLEPLSLAHHAGLCDVGLDPELWRVATAPLRTPEDVRTYIETALLSHSQGTALPFATVDQASGRVIGSTRFANIDAANRRGEIGWTWIARPWQRTAVNTEAKYMMLCHAFETLGFIRVELKTDSLNTTSQNAILRIGAKQEGVFRNHMICWDGRIRHSVYFSIIDSEWPEVKNRLEQKLAR
jgi:RimJ/RimL family protein N-acetyltransferase